MKTCFFDMIRYVLNDVTKAINCYPNMIHFLISEYSCAMQKDILIHGRLYATVNYLCFYANIFRWETSVALKWKDVNGLTKEKTALVIPNAIQVQLTKESPNEFSKISSRVLREIRSTIRDQNQQKSTNQQIDHNHIN